MIFKRQILKLRRNKEFYMKIFHHIIDHHYFAIKSNSIREGEAIPFTFYIKRGGDFVVLIEMNTYISKELYKHILNSPKIWIHKQDAHKTSDYLNLVFSPNDKSKKNVILDALSLNKTLSVTDNSNEQLKILYTCALNLMELIFDSPDDKLPLEALKACAVGLAAFVNNQEKLVHTFLQITPENYSIQHHSTNVAFLVTVLAKKAGFSMQELVNIAIAGFLHDIGKIYIDKELLNKNTTLTDYEFEVVQAHSHAGVKILEDNGFTNEHILNAIHSHHERLDGSGYPQQLRGKMISDISRMLGICDIFDALTSKRTFRFSYSSYEAFLLMKDEMRGKIDNRYLNLFIQIFTE